jgi:hypothetical protein
MNAKAKTVQSLKADYKRAQASVVAADKSAARARKAVEAARVALSAALIAKTPRTVDDYRIMVMPDDSRYWHRSSEMLDDVFGDCIFDDDGHLTDMVKEYLHAWENGEGISCYFARLEARDPVTGEWEEEDACGGFYGLGRGCAPIDQIRDQLEPREFAGEVEIVE